MSRLPLIPALVALMLACASIQAASLAPLDPISAAPAPAPGQDEERVREISKIIGKERDRTPRALYQELGKMAHFTAFKALQRALGDVKNQGSKQAIYSAMGLLRKNAELAPKVIAYVHKATLSNTLVESRAAAGAMAAFGPEAHEALFGTAEDAGDRVTRALALKGILAKVSGDPSEANLALVLDALIVPQTTSRQGPSICCADSARKTRSSGSRSTSGARRTRRPSRS